MSPRPKRTTPHGNLPQAILDTAWKQIAATGAPTLSLRAIARELKITAPAIYNYYPDRDALVTALIVDAFTSLGDSQKNTLDTIAASKLEARFTALGLAYRDWALQQEQRYQLIFGTPIPNYNAPEDITIPAAARALLPLMETIQALYQADQLRIERLPELTPELIGMLEAWQAFVNQAGNKVHAEVLYLAYVVWSRVHGLVALEIGHQQPSFISDPGEIFRREIDCMRQQYLGNNRNWTGSFTNL
jgi:AcrR family transcriptional regulator